MSKENKTVNEGRLKALNDVIASIDKEFGKGSIMKLNGEIQKVPVVSTGSLKIDDALGINGLPFGRIVEIYGPESSGKTTLTLQVVAEAQKLGKTCAFVDAEHALDPAYARKLGVDLDSLLISQPDTGEQGLEIVERLASSAAVDVIIVDSVAALTPKAEIEGDMGDSHMGLQARLMSQGLRKITSTVKKNNVLVIFINQIRSKIGVMFGSPETTTGGNALKFYASIRLDIRRTGSEKDGDVIISNTTKLKVVKNKMAPPFKEALTSIVFGAGFNIKDEVVEYATEFGIIDKSGSWYAYNGNKLGQGKQNVFNLFKEKPDVYEEIKKQVIEKIESKKLLTDTQDSK